MNLAKLLTRIVSSVVANFGDLMEQKSGRKVSRRILSHKEDEGIIADVNRRLDNLESRFTVGNSSPSEIYQLIDALRMFPSSSLKWRLLRLRNIKKLAWTSSFKARKMLERYVHIYKSPLLK